MSDAPTTPTDPTPGEVAEESSPSPFSQEVFVDLTEESPGPGEEATGDGDEAQDAPEGEQPSGTADAEPEAEEADDEGEGSPGSEATEAEEDAEAEDGSPPEADAEADEAEEDAEGRVGAHEPFQFRVDGKTVGVPGAIRGKAKDGTGKEGSFILIPEESWQRVVQPRLVDRAAVLERERKLERRLEEMDPAHHPDVVRAKAIVEILDNEVLNSEANLRAFLENFDTRRALIKEKVDNAVLGAEKEARTQRDTRTQEERDIQNLTVQITHDLPRAVETVIDSLGDRMPPRAAQAFRQRVLQNPGQFYVLATEENAQALGVPPGQLARRDDVLLQEVKYIMDLVGGLGTANGDSVTPEGNPPKGTPDAEAKRRVAAKKKRAETGKKPRKAPSPTAKAGASSTSVPQFASEAEYRKWLKS